uniref:SWIM-type domain-containing protein n=1 Tax=Glycine max TaxID=3847 RepID=A0A0R0FP05_SOYBN
MSELESSDNFCSFVNGDGLLKEECISIDSMVDIRQFDMEEITDEVVRRLDFGDLELAYQFYCWYAKISGFLVRKSHIVRNTCMETLQQTFVCSCAGYRRVSTSDRRMRREKKKAGVVMKQCFVFMCIFVRDDGHRKMSAYDIMQVENYRKVGIRPPHMYATFANQCGGYDKVEFIRKDINNEEGRMRKQHTSDASGALKYLHDLRKKDPMMYVSYTADEGSRLQRLFWCDTESQLLYEVFGDVLAFDATYKKNKYLFPFVVFFGMNHHNQTIVFATTIVTDETEETYVWLLEQLLVAMKGKAPCSIITDGDLTMMNAITRVMPVVEFEEKWKEMVATFELEDNTWIAELYEKRMKWSPAHLRDYSSTYGNEVLQTNLRSLEQSDDHLLTKEMFKLFQSYLCRNIKLRVVDCKEMATFSIYTVVKYYSGSVWLVSYCPSTVDFSCSCMRMQSIGLPCDHILVVLVSLNFMELPSSLVLNRWSKVATENIKDKYPNSAMYWDSQLMARYATLVEVSRQVCEAAYYDEDEYDKMLCFLSNEVKRLKSKKNSEPCIDDNDEQADQQGHNYDGILDPVVVRTKGCGQVGVNESGKQRRIQKCGQCGGSGHNKRSTIHNEKTSFI